MSSTSTPYTCWNYVRGHCSLRKCKYFHPTDISFQNPSATSPSNHLPNEVDENFSTNWREASPNTRIPYTPVAWKTATCKHFIQTGSCPRGDRCKFIHDSQLVRGDWDARSNVRLMKESITSSNAHCWSFVQGKCKKSSTCPYFHPSNPIPYKKYTPCLLWPNCLAGNHCSFKHPRPLKEPLQTAASNAATALSPVTSAMEYPRLTYHQDDSFDSSPSTLPQIASPVPKYFAGSRLKLFDRDFSGDLCQHPHFSPSYDPYEGIASTTLAYGDRTVSKAQFLQPTPRFQPGHARRISVPVRNPDTNVRVDF
ncbi:hypothetical protein C8R41DRAFT_423072 [Lentinula lateritia]|uniref:C3H1-type domain-containing protein n=1 Tax=Lentinula lateritia TaxID=40482 RepID=A0ABQ8VBY8_9AGAR|nr:hypothetical protein C8R41DRAFT_423072 [Lentinula lateritia]